MIDATTTTEEYEWVDDPLSKYDFDPDAPGSVTIPLAGFHGPGWEERREAALADLDQRVAAGEDSRRANNRRRELEEHAEYRARAEREAAERAAKEAERRQEQLERDTPRRLYIVHADGTRYGMDHPDSWWVQLRKAQARSDENPLRKADYMRMIQAGQEGTIVDADGDPLPKAVQRRIRLRMSAWANEDRRPEPGLNHLLPAGDHRRWLVPGVMPWATHPMLGGNKGVGKTEVVADLAGALLVPGYRFLDYFDPVELTEDELARGIWLINAETPPEDFEENLRRTGIDPEDERIHVEHLEWTGGARRFDLTDKAVYRQWSDDLLDCVECVGDDFVGPLAILVDGVTAILDNDTSRYGAWYAAFRRLMREIDTPNSLCTVHNTMNSPHPMGGVESVAGPDGIWRYQSVSQDNPFSKRYFSVGARTGGKSLAERQVHRDEDGRLRLDPGPGRGGGAGRRKRAEQEQPGDAPSAALASASEGAAPAAVPDGSAATPAAEAPPPPPEVRDLVLSYVGGCNTRGHGPSQRQLRENVAADNREVDAAVAALLTEGLLERRKASGRGGGFAHWVAGSTQPLG